MNRVRKYLWVVVAVTTLDCASGSSTKSSMPARERERVATGVNTSIELTHDAVINEAMFDASPSDVWNALMATHDQLGLPVQRAEAAEGAIIYFAPSLSRTFMGKPLSAYFDCGNGPGGQSRADTYRLSLKVIEVVDGVGAGRTRLRTEAQANARSQGVSSDALHCNSKLQLEKLIAVMVAARLER
ncbi:MAG TPA: hypothetical protein VF021_09660 [Longimicrobiales bacterium]